MVGTVRIHDREPLYAFALRTRLGDVSDAAIEERQFACQFRIDGIGTFMRRPPPIAWGDVETKPRGFVTEADVVEIAAHSEVAVAANTNKALNELFDGPRLPFSKCRSGDFTDGNGAQAVWSLCFKNARCAQVGGDNLGNLAAKRGAVACWCVGRCRRDEGGDSDGAGFGGVEFDQFGFIVLSRNRRRRNCLGICRNRQQREQRYHFPG